MKSLQSPFHNSFSFNYVMCRIDGNAYMCHHQYYLDARKTPFCILQLTIGNNMRHVGYRYRGLGVEGVPKEENYVQGVITGD